MRSRRKVQNRMSVLKRTGKKNVLALALAIAMVSSTVAGEPLSIHAYADETNAISSSDDGSSKSDASSEKSTSVKEEKTTSKEEKTETKTEKSSEEKSGTSVAAKSAIQIVTEAENSASSDTKSSDVKLGTSDNDTKATEKDNASGQKSSGSTGNTSANSSYDKSTEATGTGASQSSESSKENTTETEITTTDAAKSGTASSDATTAANTSTGASTSTDVNGSASKGTGASTSTGSSTGAASTGAGAVPETTAPETNAPETSQAETTAAVETTEAETTAPETTAELDEEAEKKAESARIRKGILAADTAARKAKLGKTGSWKSSIFDFVKHLFYINVVADAENEADDVEDESISEMEVSEDDIDDYSVDLGKDYTANVVDDEDHTSGKNCFTSIIMARKVSGKWKAQSEFHDEDSVRISLAVSIPSDAMDEDSRVFYYQLPSAVTISEAQSGLMKRDDIVIGKYVLTEDGMLVVKLTDNISVNQKFRGIIVFDAELAKADDQTMEKIDFGSFVFILHDGVSNDSTDGDAEDIDADVTDETEPTDTVQDDANKVATESEIDADGELNTRAGVLRVSNRIVTASANFPAETFPIGTKMQVVRVKKPSELKTLKTKVDEQLENENSGKIAKDIYAYDISFIYDGEKIEPLNPVDISLSFNKSQGKPKATKAEDPEKAEWKMFHATEDGEIAEKTDVAEDTSEETQEDETLESVKSTATESAESADQNNASAEDASTTEETTSDASENADTITENHVTDLVTENSVLHDITEDAEVSTDSDNTVVHKVDFSSDAFSVYVLAYTVDFHYGDYTWSMEGEQSVLLSELFKILGIEKEVKDVENVTFSNTDLVNVEKVTDDSDNLVDWRLTSLEPFTSEELLTIDFYDGHKISVVVTDDQTTGIDLTSYIKTVTLQRKGQYEQTWSDITNGVLESDSVRFNITYSLPAGTIKDASTEAGRTLVYQVPNNFSAIKGDSGKVLDDSNKEEIGTYEITADGKIKIIYYEAFAAKNVGKDGQKIDGHISFSAEVKNIKTDDSGSTTVKFIDNLKFGITITDRTFNTEDLQVNKGVSSYDEKTGIATYTITVTSKNGTATAPVVTDVLNGDLYYNVNGHSIKITRNNQDVTSNASIDYQTSNGNRIEDNAQKLVITLPGKMEANDTYIITYETFLKDYEGLNGSKNAENTVNVEAQNEHGGKLSDDASVSVTFNRNVLNKTGVKNPDGTVTWTVTVNESKVDISGYTLSDFLNDVEYKENVSIKDSNGNVTTVQLPYTFPSGSSDTYTIEYITRGDYKAGAWGAVNKVVLTKDNNEITKEYTVGDGSGQQFNPLTKTAEELSVNNNTATITWKVRIDATKGSLTSGSYYNDVLWNDQYLTDNQITELENNVKSALEKIGFNSGDYSLTGQNPDESVENSASENYSNDKNFRITFKKEVPKGSIIEFTYHATSPVSNDELQDGKKFANRGLFSDGTKNMESNPEIKYEPVVKKLDHVANKTEDTKHDFYDYDKDDSDLSRKISYGGYMAWEILVRIPSDAVAPVTIQENLPANATFKDLELRVEDGIGTNWFQAQDSEGKNYIWSASANGANYRIPAVKNSDGSMTITLDKDFVEYAKQDKVLHFVIRAQANSDIDWSNEHAEIFKNEVVIKDKDGKELGRDTQQQTFTKSTEDVVIKKTASVSEEEKNLNRVHYRVIVNPEGKDLLENSNTLTFKDTLPYDISWSDHNSCRVDLVPNSVHVYHLNNDGSNGTEFNIAEIPYTYENKAGSYANGRICELNITIPDSTAMVIEYVYEVTGKEGDNIGLNNTATLEGTSDGNHSSGTYTNVNVVTSNAGAVASGINIYKVDAENNGIYLNDAKFQIFKYNGSKYVLVSEDKYITGPQNGDGYSDGKLNLSNFDGFDYNTAYYLKETDAPENYNLAEDTYFYIYNSDVSKYPSVMPSDFKGERLVDGAIINVKDESNVTSITVNKKWFHDNGDAFTPETGSIKFELYKKYISEGSDDKEIKGYMHIYNDDSNMVWKHEVFYANVGDTITIILNPGSYQVDSNNMTSKTMAVYPLFDKDNPDWKGDIIETVAPVKEGNDYVYKFTVKESYKDAFTICLNNGYLPTDYNYETWRNYSRYSVQSPADLVPKPKDVKIKTDEIKASDGWSKTIYKLPKSETINGVKYDCIYSVKEIEVSGCTVDYENNDVANGLITIKNTELPGYYLPATGSRGTTWIYLLGSIILLLGAEWYLITHKEVSRK